MRPPGINPNRALSATGPRPATEGQRAYGRGPGFHRANPHQGSAKRFQPARFARRQPFPAQRNSGTTAPRMSRAKGFLTLAGASGQASAARHKAAACPSARSFLYAQPMPAQPIPQPSIEPQARTLREYGDRTRTPLGWNVAPTPYAQGWSLGSRSVFKTT